MHVPESWPSFSRRRRSGGKSKKLGAARRFQSRKLKVDHRNCRGSKLSMSNFGTTLTVLAPSNCWRWPTGEHLLSTGTLRCGGPKLYTETMAVSTGIAAPTVRVKSTSWMSSLTVTSIHLLTLKSKLQLKKPLKLEPISPTRNWNHQNCSGAKLDCST